MTSASAVVPASSPQRLVVQQLVPTRREVELDLLMSSLGSAAVVMPFDTSRVEFLADVSRRLGRRAARLPESQSLAYWMRRTELHRMAESFDSLQSAGSVLMPRGTVFHIPPANVDTLFVYSWALSTLVGNRNIVRLSSRATDQSNLIIDTIDEVLQDHPEVSGSSAMVTYGHDDEISSVISACCDVRVIWGGNETVNGIRSLPIAPHATELTFADRFSMAAIGTAAYEQLSDIDRDHLAELFFNDAYWFDQLGCSSARLVLWVGDQDPTRLAKEFYGRVVSVADRKSYSIDASASIAKLSQAYRTLIDENVAEYYAPADSLTMLDMHSFPDVRGAFCGGGLFYHLHLKSLSDLAPHIRRADQTLATFGIDEAALHVFVREVCGRGLDRIVPFGQALQFSRFWDGYDLLAEFTRRVTVTTGGRFM